jgi:hypothetical protein
LRQPASTPYPASEDGIEDSADEKLAKEKRPKRDSLADSAHDDVTRCLHEDHFKERQAHAPGVVAGPGKKKALAAQKAPQTISEKELN